MVQVRELEQASLSQNDNPVRPKFPLDGVKSRVTEEELKTRGKEEDEEYRDDDDATRTTTANTTTIIGPSGEDLRRIVQESLAGHESSRVEGFVARTAMLECEVAHWSDMYKVAQARYEALKERVKVREGSEEELRLVCVEQRGTTEEYKREVQRLEVERNGAVGRHEAEREEFDRERREMEAELAKRREAHAADLNRLMDEEVLGQITSILNIIKQRLDEYKKYIVLKEEAEKRLQSCEAELEKVKAEYQVSVGLYVVGLSRQWFINHHHF